MWNKYVDIHIICITVSDKQRGLKGDEIMLSQFKRQFYDHIGLLFDSSNTNDLISFNAVLKERTLLGKKWKLCQDENFFLLNPGQRTVKRLSLLNFRMEQTFHHTILFLNSIYFFGKASVQEESGR